MKKIFYIHFLVFAQCLLFAQKQQADSIRQLIKADKEDTLKVTHLNDLAYLYRNARPDSTILLCKKSIALCEQLMQNSNLKLWTGYSDAIGNMAIGYRLSGNFVKAKEFYFKALKMDEELGYKFGIGKRLVGIANVYDNLANYAKALEFGFKALKVNEEINNQRAIALSYGVIGNTYFDQKEYDKAMTYELKALTTFEQINDKNNVAASYVKMGIIYSQQKKYSKAFAYLNMALNIAEKSKLEQLYAETLNNIAFVYLEQNQYDQALAYYLKGLEKDKELNINTGISNAYNFIGYIYLKKKDFLTSEKYLLDALNASKAVGALKNQLQVETNLAELYQQWNKPLEALAHFKKAVLFKDSIFNTSNTQQIMNIEFEKKEMEQKAVQEKKDALAAAEKKKQQVILFFVALGLLSVLIFAVFIFRSLNIRKKQNVVIAMQKQKVEEKQKEILDSIHYAERIQRAFLATKEVLDKNLKEYFIFFKPKDVVSGDFYWATNLGNGNFILATADSTGHGVPGAIMSLLNITSLEKAAELSANPSDILNHTRNTIINRLKRDGSEDGGKDGMDCSLLCFDFENKLLKLAAANNPVWILRNNELIEIKPDKMPVGKSDKQLQTFTLHSFALEAGDTIYTLTDGFPDQFGGPNGKKFMSKRLKELLCSNAHLPLSQQKEIVETTFDNWIGDLEQVDDVCVIGIKI